MTGVGCLTEAHLIVDGRESPGPGATLAYLTIPGGEKQTRRRRMPPQVVFYEGCDDWMDFLILRRGHAQDLRSRVLLLDDGRYWHFSAAGKDGDTLVAESELLQQWMHEDVQVSIEDFAVHLGNYFRIHDSL